mmetsp:Transcript_51214/g.133209  ORF Transcript_51214/g.133209 Transcript_51214/m.133209 type:complete len:222 (+) Transcript_51214:356-1021(+)
MEAWRRGFPDNAENFLICLSWLRETCEMRYYHLCATLITRGIARHRAVHAIVFLVQRSYAVLVRQIDDTLVMLLGRITNHDLRHCCQHVLVLVKIWLEKHDARIEIVPTPILDHANGAFRKMSGIQQVTQLVTRNVRVCIQKKNTPDWESEGVDLFQRILVSEQECLVDARVTAKVGYLLGGPPVRNNYNVPASLLQSRLVLEGHPHDSHRDSGVVRHVTF